MTDAQGSKRPKGRTLAEFGKLSTAERKLLDCAAAGGGAVFGKERPESAIDAKTLRGTFIRFLALGGDEDAPVHETGVQLQGAWIEGAFDLEGVETKGGLLMVGSAFEAAPVFRDSRIRGSLNLAGSKMPGLQGDRLTCDGSLFLRGGFVATGEVRLLGAKIGSDLVCAGGTFQNEGHDALSADGVDVGGNVFLNDKFTATGEVRLLGAKIGSDLVCAGGTFQNEGHDALSADGVDVGGNVFLNDKFTATGEVRLLGAKIGSDLVCAGGTFQNEGHDALSADGVDVGGNVILNDKFTATGKVRLLGAKIEGDLVCRGGKFRGKQKAIDMQQAHIRGTLMIDGVTIEAGILDLNSATASRLVDDSKTWAKGVVLDGFVYGAFGGTAPTDAKMRIDWLDQQPGAHSGKDGNGSTFRPQPWQQLRKVLREMGHYEAAREVGIAFERRKRECGLIGQMPEISVGQALRAVGGSVYGKTARLLHIGYGALVGYGYRPLRLLMIATVVWLVFGGGYFAAARWDGAFVPSTQALFSRYGGMCGLPAHVRWTDCKAIRLEYPQFYPLAYSLNVLLPVGNLGQEATWRPETGTWGGRIAQFAVWFETLFGWMTGLILVAVVSGLAKRDE
ncbi:hypothetical protein [Acidiphilium sp.]|uniref:hypothetical protein n=2 Tax=unclassified Acidiphilium TaxID=2617493 RepID=UPI002C973C7A|nr:hypothetical protein [Acidiphilium sp.]HQT62709.1 hypothetical protein [Acidiphilium sp.]